MKRLMTYLVLLLGCGCSVALAQVPMGGGRIAAVIGPRGSALPDTCSLGQVFSKTGASAGAYWCNESGSWVGMTGGGSDATSAVNSGAGAAILKTGTNVTARTLVAGTGVSVTGATDTVTIAAAKVSSSFTSQTSVAIAHNLGTTDVLVRCYTADSPPVLVEPSSITLTDTNTVTVAFNSAQSGKCVVW